jgi:DNA-binding PadR family transcriptional regulator
MSKRLPVLTHLQFLVLEALAGRERAGRDLRKLLAAHGVRNSAPAFYQMMGRLEEARLVDGAYDQRIVAGQHIKERRYTITKAGLRAVADTRAFYQERLTAGLPARRIANG